MPLLDGDQDFAAKVVAIGDLARAAAAARHRRLVLLSGAAGWCRDVALEGARRAGCTELLWLAGAPPARACVMTLSTSAESGPGAWVQAEMPGGPAAVLGSETRGAVVDAARGLDADALGMVLGSVAAGGLLMLLTPARPPWVTGNDLPAGHSRYLGRLAALLCHEPGVLRLREDRPVGSLPPGSPAPAADHWEPCETRDQRQAVQAIIGLGRQQRVLVLSSDRGRGKSAAMGMAAAHLMQTRKQRIVLTGPRLDAVGAVLRHAAARLPAAETGARQLSLGEGSLRFLPPDRLVVMAPKADLLLVDEAATIPAPLLTRLLTRFRRVVFATTVHGYEGSGRGFQLRFRRVLDEKAPGWRLLHLREPIRYATDDPLESLGFRALLLDAEPAPGELLRGVSPASCDFALVDRDILAARERPLRETAGLLVQAHYRTRPGDLMQMLDARELDLYAMRFQGHVVGVLLVATEEPLHSQLADAVWAGWRRPRGRLLMQSLVAYLGLRGAAGMRCARVVRIAVHPALQRRGLGQRMLELLAADRQGEGFDLLGASFGASPELVDFWAAQALHPVRLGFSRGAASGMHALLVLRGLSPGGQALVQSARRRFRDQFPELLWGPLRELEPRLALELLSRCGPSASPGLSDGEWRELGAFAFAARPLEDSLPLLRRWFLPLCQGCALPREQDSDLLLAVLLQGRSPKAVAETFGVAGRVAVLRRLRGAVGALLRQTAPPSLRDAMGLADSRAHGNGST